MGLSAYSMVTMADGSTKRAEDVVEGDRVWDPIAAAAVEVRKVWQGPGVGMRRIRLEDGSVLDLTGDNPVATRDGASPADRLTAGAQVLTGAGYALCAASEGLAGDYMVYDIVARAGAAARPCVFANGVVAAIQA